MSKKYPEITEQTRWENDEVKLVQLYGLATGPGHYTRIKNRDVQALVIHHADSNPREGQRAPVGIAKFHAGKPKYKTDSNGNLVYRTIKGKKKAIWIGGGRGWPGIGYQYVIPTYPDIEEEKAVIYQCHDDDIWSWHTGAGVNKHGLGICMAGCFRSEHYPNNPLAQPAPDPVARRALEQLVVEYLLPKHNLTLETGLFGHFDFGKPACPGDWLEQWVRHMRGEAVPHPEEEFLDDPDGPDGTSKPKKKTEVELVTAKERQQALLNLGFDLGKWGADGQWGQDSKAALMAFQEFAGLKVDGVWGPRTDAAVKKALDEQK